MSTSRVIPERKWRWATARLGCCRAWANTFSAAHRSILYSSTLATERPSRAVITPYWQQQLEQELLLLLLLFLSPYYFSSPPVSLRGALRLPGALAGRIKRADAPSGAPSVAGLPPYTQHSFFFFFHFNRQLFFSLDSFDYYPPKRNHLKSPSSANRCVSSKSDCGSSFRLFCFFSSERFIR